LTWSFSESVVASVHTGGEDHLESIQNLLAIADATPDIDTSLRLRAHLCSDFGNVSHRKKQFGAMTDIGRRLRLLFLYFARSPSPPCLIAWIPAIGLLRNHGFLISCPISSLRW
jgi:hypothetical protein